MKVSSFLLISPRFHSYLAMIYWVLLKYDINLVSFSKIQRKFGNFLFKSGGFSSNPTKIWCYFAQI